MDNFCCDILCPEQATHKIVYSLTLDLGEFGYTFSCPLHIPSLSMSQEDICEKL